MTTNPTELLEHLQTVTSTSSNQLAVEAAQAELAIAAALMIDEDEWCEFRICNGAASTSLRSLIDSWDLSPFVEAAGEEMLGREIIEHLRSYKPPRHEPRLQLVA